MNADIEPVEIDPANPLFEIVEQRTVDNSKVRRTLPPKTSKAELAALKKEQAEVAAAEAAHRAAKAAEPTRINQPPDLIYDEAGSTPLRDLMGADAEEAAVGRTSSPPAPFPVSASRVDGDDPGSPEVIALRLEVARLTALLDERNSDYSNLLQQRAGPVVTRIDPVRANRELHRRRNLALMPTPRLASLVQRNGDARTAKYLIDKVGRASLIELILEHDAIVAAR